MASALEKIGRLLVQRGVLTEEQLSACLREQAATGGASLSRIILDRKLAADDRLTQALDGLGALTFRCPEGCGKIVVKHLRLDAPYACQKCGHALESDEPKVQWNSTAEPDLPADVAEASRDAKRTLGKYILVKELGRGGSAVVYKAWDSILRQYVALKLIGAAGASLPEDPESREVKEFLREARTAIKLSHPHIVRVYEVGCHEGRYFLSMELVEGGSLAKLLHGKDTSRRPRFYSDPSRYVTILRDIASAVDHAHHQTPPIVHRDVKPHNVLVDPSGRACLADFGLAREIGAGRLTATGIAKGTPCYMAPEQAKVNGGRLDARTDVYGLGAILYECLAGDPPFTGPSSHEILRKVVDEDPIPPSQVVRGRANPPEALERICLKALEKDPLRRYASAAQFAADLDRYLSGRSVQATGVSAPTRAARWIARRKAIVIPAAAAVVMGIVALVALMRGGSDRVVERIVVRSEEKKTDRIEDKIREVDQMAAGLRVDEALERCNQLRLATKDPATAAHLSQMADDIRLERTMLQGVVDRIRIQPRDYRRFALADTEIATAQVADAAMDRILIVHGGVRAGYPWASVAPEQFVQLVRDYWPDIDGKPALGLALWARRHKIEATAKAKPAESPETQYFKLLHEAERALSQGNLAVARDRFEKALVLQDGAEAKDGLQRVAAAEAQRKAAEKPAEKPAAKAPDPVLKPESTWLEEEEAKDLFKEAQEEFDADHYREAMAIFSTIAVRSREKKFQAEAFQMRGFCRYMVGEWQGSLQDFTAAVTIGSGSDNYVQLFLWLLGARMGDKAKATAALKAYTPKGVEVPSYDPAWYRLVCKYLLDELDETQFLRLSGEDSPQMKRVEKECEANFYVGSKHLVDGDAAGAPYYFKRCVDTNVVNFLEHHAARAELKRAKSAAAAPPKPEPAKPAPAAPAPPELGPNERLILSVPANVSWSVLSISPDGASAAYVESKAGKKTVAWTGGRLDAWDDLDSTCLWTNRNLPVVKGRRAGKMHAAIGPQLYEGFDSIGRLVLSSNRQQLAYVAKSDKTFVVAKGVKTEFAAVEEKSLVFNPSGQLFYMAAVEPGTYELFLDGERTTLEGYIYSTAQEAPPVWSPDGGRVAFSSVRGISDGGAQYLETSGGVRIFRVYSPRFSGDSRVLAWIAEVQMGSPKKMVVVGKTQGAKFEDIAGAPVLSRDGKTVAYIAKQKGKWIVVAGGKAGEEFDFIPPKVYDVEQPVVSSDGKLVAYVAQKGAALVLVANGKIVDEQGSLSAPQISADGRSISYGYVNGLHFIWKTLPVVAK